MNFPYSGDILTRRVLKANLPTSKVVGDWMYFAKTTTGAYEIWINDKDGTLVCVAKDVSTDALAALQQQITDLSGKASISDTSSFITQASILAWTNTCSVETTAMYSSTSALPDAPTTNGGHAKVLMGVGGRKTVICYTYATDPIGIFVRDISAGAWQQTNWSRLVQIVNRTSVDLNTIFNTGTEGYCTSCTNRPPGISDGFFKDYYSQYSNLGYQEYTEYSTGRKFKRKRFAPDWGSWNEFATTDKIDTLWTGDASSGDITLSNVMTAYNELIVLTNKVNMYYHEAIRCVGIAYPVYQIEPVSIGHSSGAVLYLTPKVYSADNKIYTITSGNGISILSIKGIKKGSV